MRALTLILLIAGTVICSHAGQPIPDEPYKRTIEQRLRMEEAEAVVELYEVRLKSARIQLQQEDVNVTFTRDTFTRVFDLSRNHAAPAKDVESTGRDFKLAQLEYAQTQQDVAELEVMVKLAKIQKRLVECGAMESVEAPAPHLSIRRGR
jgi:multidrug resistance efflux pump